MSPLIFVKNSLTYSPPPDRIFRNRLSETKNGLFETKNNSKHKMTLFPMKIKKERAQKMCENHKIYAINLEFLIKINLKNFGMNFDNLSIFVFF